MRGTICVWVMATALCACAVPQPPEGRAAHFAAMPTATLWTQHRQAASALDTALIEAELGSRGQTTDGLRHIGETTALAYGRRLYARPTVRGDATNCGDFPNAAAAQKFFLAAGGPTQDPHGLDRDGDGLACEWGHTLRTVAAKARVPAPARAVRRPSSSYCHVGPRGGRYTITASGRKNYGGC